MNMFFSVIVPVYNVEQYLHESIDSILKQTCQDFELILVDDGSRDSSPMICDAYAQQHTNVIVIHKENGGQSTARNMGVRAAQGEYAVFLDSDDMISSERFLEDLQRVIKDDTDIVIFRYEKYYNKNKMSDCGIKMNGLDGLPKEQLIRELVRRDAFFCSCWSKCTRMSLLKKNKIEFDEHLSCEDMDWYFTVMEKARTMLVIDKPYVYYRQRENSVTSAFKPKSVTDYIFTISKWKERFERMPEGMEKEALLSALAKLYCNLLISYSRHMDDLKDVKRQIFAFKGLLKHDLNPRTRKIHQVSSVIGVSGMCRLLRFVDHIK